MSLRNTPFSIGEYYHVYNRGVDKRIIFIDDNDYGRFVALLYLCNSSNPVRINICPQQGKTLQDIQEVSSVDRGEQIVDIGAYCLMPNHFHILLYERIDGGISKFMCKLSTAYSMYFNKKYERRGSLFEGKFKSKYIDNEPYFNWVFSYIHLNPIKLIDKGWKEKGILEVMGAKKFIDNYRYSSYYDYFIGDSSRSIILNKNVFPEYFSNLNNFEILVQEFSKNKK